MVEFCIFLQFLELSERNYNSQSCWMALCRAAKNKFHLSIWPHSHVQLRNKYSLHFISVSGQNCQHCKTCKNCPTFSHPFTIHQIINTLVIVEEQGTKLENEQQPTQPTPETISFSWMFFSSADLCWKLTLAQYNHHCQEWFLQQVSTSKWIT